MTKMLWAAALLMLAFSTAAMACEGADNASAAPTVTTAQGDSSGPASVPAPQAPGSGG